MTTNKPTITAQELADLVVRRCIAHLYVIQPDPSYHCKGLQEFWRNVMSGEDVLFAAKQFDEWIRHDDNKSSNCCLIGCTDFEEWYGAKDYACAEVRLLADIASPELVAHFQLMDTRVDLLIGELRDMDLLYD